MKNVALEIVRTLEGLVINESSLPGLKAACLNDSAKELMITYNLMCRMRVFGNASDSSCRF